MITVKELYNYIDSFAPFETADGFDNVGHLIGDPDAQVKNILVSLDVTAEVLTEAIEKKCTLIVSHHPIIFQPLKQVMADSLVYQLIHNNISVLSAHTNLDKADEGVNDALCVALQLSDVRKFDGSEDMGRIGILPNAMTPELFAGYVKNCLGAAGIRYVAGNQDITRVAVLGGGGDFALQASLDAGATALVTGEAKHHIFLDAHGKGMTFVDAGHFDTENVVCPVLQQKLSEQFPETTIYLSEIKTPVKFI